MTFDDDLKAAVRTIPDYPKPGILFRDITTLLGDARSFRRAVDELVQPWAGMKIDKVAGIEARGFILGGAVAHQVSAGFIPIRQKGQLPHKRVSIATRSNTVSTRWRCTRTRWGRARDRDRRPDRDRRRREGAAAVAPMGDRYGLFIIDLPGVGGAAAAGACAARCHLRGTEQLGPRPPTGKDPSGDANA